MEIDYLKPATRIGKNVNCLTLTDHFFKKNEIDSNKSNLLRDFHKFDGVPIQYMEQVHGSTTQIVNSYSVLPKLKTDALLSSRPNLALAAFSADCMPIAIARSDGSEFALLHAGWKGLYEGVIESCVKTFSSSDSNLNAWIGPSISSDNYEVDKDLFEAFTEKNAESKSNFSERSFNKWSFDLQGEATRILNDFGVDVQNSHFCTYDSEIMYSFRREETEKRMLTIIWRNE